MKNKILFITVATGKYYDKYVYNLFNSMNEYIKFDFDFLCLTDKTNDLLLGINHSFMPFLPFPFSTLMRYYYMWENKKTISKYDYVFYIDSDMKIIDDITTDILSDSVCVLHPGFYEKPVSEFSYEKNEKSLAYVKEGEGINYYQGCLQGGAVKTYLNMCETLKENIAKDLYKNIIAEWHDESHMNRYMIDNPPSLILSPDYAMPEKWVGVKKEKTIVKEVEYRELFDVYGLPNGHEAVEIDRSFYNINYESTKPKIIHLDKNHEEIRSL